MDLFSPTSPLPAVAATLLALGTAVLLWRHFGAPTTSGRFASIDGLRGYLAFFVFLHHGCTWFFYQGSGEWAPPPSKLYNHLGQGSVTMFFMITSFLFFTKLLAARERPMDWLKLVVSRVLRLAPLYLCVMLALFLTVGVLSEGQLREPVTKVGIEVVRWLGFTMRGAPPINRIEITGTILAGVIWSLPYEIYFYCSLPLLAMMVGVLPRWPYLALSVALMTCFVAMQPMAIYLWAFAGGIAAALSCRSAKVRQFASSRLAGGLVLGILAIAVSQFATPLAYAPLLLLSIAFTLIACGNTLFGLLLHPASRVLGEMAYSIYLLHGILLFTLFHFVLGVDRPGAALASRTHWAWVLALAPVVVLVSYASFQVIEAPAMRATSRVTRALRRRLRNSPETISS